ncbi:MFS transporter, partial [Dactylosporangium sp. NPDC051485]|uniref:MFS transporter n=1 Tax=Dactylosporangium sp. NPDC051485 TaxID=3154846 RepID=UPI00343E9D3B
ARPTTAAAAHATAAPPGADRATAAARATTAAATTAATTTQAATTGATAAAADPRSEAANARSTAEPDSPAHEPVPLDAAGHHTAAGKPGVSLGAAFALLRRRDFRMVVIAATVMGLATIGDGFVYLVLQRHHAIATGWFPLLAVGTNLAYLLLAVPLGHLADRVGRARVYLGGFAALAVVYGLLAAGGGGTAGLVVTVALYGAFYAATDGVLMALAGPLLPEALKTTGIALVQSGQSLAYLGSSILFGAAWQWWGPGPALCAAAGAALTALALVTSILRRGTTKHA